MRKVFVLNKGGHDYSDATRFGELVFCTEGSLAKEDIQQMYRVLYEPLQFSHADDYILITSLASLCSVGCAIFGAMHSRLNLLIFSQGRYDPHTIIIPN